MPFAFGGVASELLTGMPVIHQEHRIEAGPQKGMNEEGKLPETILPARAARLRPLFATSGRQFSFTPYSAL